jgi:hypothetical protein
LRKLAIVVLLALVGFVSIGTQRAQAQVVNFCFENHAPYIIYVRMFSKSRNAVWPPSGGWVLDDRARHCVRLACIVGEKICFGAFDGAGRNWGVGYNNTLGCPNCCGTCGTVGNDWTYNWALED